ncbi:MAG: hypothetical protein ACRDG7_10860 [Candidatus Limnocylindria bacterium]
MSTIPGPSPASGLARLTRAIARTTAPLSRPLAGRRSLPLWAVLHHRGRRSGRAYAVSVAIRASDDTFTIALPWGDRTEWLRNVLAAGGCTIRWKGTDHLATQPSVIGIAEAGPAFSRVQRSILHAAGVRSFLRLRRSL